MSYGLAAYATQPYGGWATGLGNPPASLSNTILDPAGVAVPGVVASVFLKPGPGFQITSSNEVARQRSVRGGDDGVWAMELVPNSAITPAGTYYRVVQRFEDGTETTWLITHADAGETLGEATPWQPA